MRPISVIVCLIVALAGPIRAHAGAPQHAAEVWETLRQAPDVNDARRAQIVRVLEHPLTRDVAGKYELDLDAAVRAVPVLDGPELQQISERAASVEAGLAGGGDSITISTTILIIALLIVILILVAD